jgi:isoquinoline 1-oxidoreductase beta subunit
VVARSFDRSRRRLLQAGAAAGGALVLGVRIAWPAAQGDAGSSAAATFAPNAWVRIGGDGAVTVVIDRSEMGQGSLTGLAMLVAEELAVDLAAVRTEFAPAAPEYANPLIGAQVTGGSTAIRAAWTPLRAAGAAAREMLVAAAAARWGVAAGACRAQGGAVLHPDSGRRLGYGELAAQAAKRPVPRDVPLKKPAQFDILGRSTPGLDIPDKVRGRTVYGADVSVPGKLVAVVARCPVFGGRATDIEDARALSVKGVRRVVRIDSGVAVVAEDTWSALRGREALQVRWDEGALAGLDSAAIRGRFAQAAQRGGRVVHEVGRAQAALREAPQTLEVVYETPYVAHLPMEPMNCTAWVRSDACELWVPTQAQTGAQRTAAHITGLAPEAVSVHTTFLGGGFGRRLEQDFVAEAVQIAKAVGEPVQVVWMLEDDLAHDFYRPANYTLMRGALDTQGRPLAWVQRIVGPSNSFGGVDVPYRIPNQRQERVEEDPGVPTGAWRSVGASQNAFVVESFVDELAYAAGADPLRYRRELLGHAPRHRRVLELAAQKAGWSRPPPAGRQRGIAVYFSFGSWVAQVVEVSVSADAGVRVHRVVCAIDCGIAVNPDSVTAQLEGAVAMALTAALKGEITIERGRVAQRNFHDYPLLSFAEMPAVEVHIMPSEASPGGVGEPGVPPLAPALANAVFAATGRRIRRLPLGPDLVR